MKKPRSRVLVGLVGVALLAGVGGRPAGADPKSAGAGTRVEDHVRWVESQWTDCPATPPTVPFECTGAIVRSYTWRGRVGSTLLNERVASVDLFRVTITAQGATIAQQPYASGGTTPEQLTITSDYRARVRATVPLDDGTSARVRLAYVPDGEPETDVGGASQVHRQCDSGRATIDYRVLFVEEEVSGEVIVHGHRFMPTSFVERPFFQRQDDRGVCL